MTEYELLDAFFSAQEVFSTGMTFYLSVLSGYLVVAYVAGKNLNVFQLTVISIGFVIVETLVIVIEARRLGEVIRLAAALVELDPEYPPPLPTTAGVAILCVAIAGVLAGLAFMWNARRGNAS